MHNGGLIKDYLIDLINDINELIFVKDDKFAYQFVNPAFCKFLNKNKSDIISKSDFEIFPSNEADIFRKYDLEIQSSLKPIRFELLITGYKGKIWTEVNEYPILKDDRLVGIKSIVRDISPNKISQLQLIEESEKILKSFFDSGKDLIEKSESSAIIPAIENVYKQHQEGLSKLKASSLPESINEKNLFWCGFINDINENKKSVNLLKKMLKELSDSKSIIETNLYQKNALIEELTIIKLKLEKTNAEKDKFFSIISHDLRSPFSGFLGLTQIISEQFEDLSMSSLMEIGKSMHNSASNLFRLLENLLEWSRMLQGKIEFNPIYYPINELIQQTVNVNKSLAGLKRITINNNIKDEINAFIDVRMIETIFRNFLSNAIKFTPQGGIIQIDAYNNENEIIISFKDNGIGMNNDLVGKLFNLSEKTNRVGTEGELSSGLGLILSKEFIQKHNGKLWVESQEDVGSTFYLSIPVK